MTSVTISELADGWLFECTGHAGSNEEYSEDIVCAAVSALCITLARNLELAATEGLITLPQFAVSDGYVFIEITYAQDEPDRRTVDTMVRTVLNGFDAISEDYGEYIELYT